MKKYLIMAAMMLLVAATSCKKEEVVTSTEEQETESQSHHMNQVLAYYAAQLSAADVKTNTSPILSDVIEGGCVLLNDTTYPDYDAVVKNIVKPLQILKPTGVTHQRMPQVLREMKDNPEFSALWDFDRWETQPSDTVGFQVYFIPPVRNEETEILNGWNILTIGVENNIVTRKYVLSFPGAIGLNFDEYIQDCKSHYRDIPIEFLSYDYNEIFLGGYYSTSLRDFVRMYGQGRDGNNYSSGIITYDEYGHRVIEYVPFQDLQHSGDWNDCDRAYFIAGKIVGVGLTIAGYASGVGFVAGALIRGANAYFWKKVRKEVCH